jgi:hypothetical protein
MARYRVLAWRGIAAQVRARHDTCRPVRRGMPDWLHPEIDRLTMHEGLAGTARASRRGPGRRTRSRAAAPRRSPRPSSVIR